MKAVVGTRTSTWWSRLRPPGALLAVLAGIIMVVGSSTLASAQTDPDRGATVRMRGTTGEEQVRITVDGEVLVAFAPTSSWNNYNFTVPAGPQTIRVEFLNDGRTQAGSDKNVIVDWLSVAGMRFDSESPDVLSKGVWNGADCGEGYRESEFLACNGWFQFEVPEGTSTTSSTSTTLLDPRVDFAVFARGTTGTEDVDVLVNGASVASYTLNTTDKWHYLFIPTSEFIDGDPRHPDNVVRFAFINDGRDANGVDRNVRVGAFELDGVTYNPVDLKSKGSWNGTDCGEGFRNTNWIHCGGWFEIAGGDEPPPPPPPDTVLLGALLRGTTGTEEMGIQVNGQVVSTFGVTTEDLWYDTQIPVDLFVDGDPDHPDNQVRVVFLNDGRDPVAGDRNVYASAFEFNGPIYSPRDLKSKGSWNGTDCGEGFRNSNWIHCAGWFEIVGPDSPPPPPPEDAVFLDVVARGSSGTELISIEINGQIIEFEDENGELATEFQLGSSVTPYYFDIVPDVFVNSDPTDPANVVRVLFVNDGRTDGGIDRDIYVSELAFNGAVLDPKALKSKGVWNGTDCGEGFRNSNRLSCNGWFELVGGDDDGGGGNGSGGGDDLPGTGKTITMGRANWASGYFHAQVIHNLLEELGYEVTSPDALEQAPDRGYLSIADGDMDFWANGWFPNHDIWWTGARSDGDDMYDHLRRVPSGPIRSGPLQGMIVTKAWAEANNITTLDQINSDQGLWSQLDSDGNGAGEFYGCPTQWLCDDIMDSQIAFAGWDNLEQVKDGYDAMFADFMEKVDGGEPAIMYLWMPTAYHAQAEIGDKTLWLSVEDDSVLDDSNPLGIDGGENFNQRDVNGNPDVYGWIGPDQCLPGPAGCQLGWRRSNIDVVANTAWLADNPSAEELLQRVDIYAGTISDALLEIERAGGSQAAVEAAAADWIADNRYSVDQWLRLANPAFD